MFNALEGDGVIDNIYHFLWTKDTIFNSDPSVYIPQTILFKYQKPCYWYFTSVVDHKLKKKNSSKLNKENISQVFLKHVSKSGIVAYYIYKKNNVPSKYISDKPTFDKIMKNLDKDMDKSEASKNNSLNENIQKKNEAYIIEYFDLKKFNDFLDKKIVYDDGILQKFEDPKGEYNITYRLTWSPKLSLFEKCTNLRKIYDKHFDIYERAVTYDGEEFQTKTEPIKGNHIPQRIEKIGLNIVNHVSNITLEKIKIIRLILNFKIDKKDRIIFLWCSSLRILNTSNVINPRLMSIKERGKIEQNFFRKQQNIKEIDNEKIRLRPPDYVNLFKYSVSGKPILPQKESVCLNCGQKVENYRLYEISFKTIIEGHDNRKRDKQYYSIFNKINMTSSGVEVIPCDSDKKTFGEKNEIIEKLKENKINNFIIPKIIQELYPKLKFQDYFSLKYDTFFRNKTTCVCDDCYLEITKYCSMAGSNNENLLRAFKKDDINPIFDMFKSMRPKTVKNKGRVTFLTELGGERPRINLEQHKKSLLINEENPNNVIESNARKKRQTMANIVVNFNFTNQSQNPNLNSINSINSNQTNEINKLKKSNNNKILPKLNLDSINETNFGERKIRKNKRNKTTMVLNLNFGNKNNKEEKEEKEKEEEKEENDEKEEKEKLIQKTFEFKRKSTSASKNKVKNYFSKSDFKYFN
jgi:hypothetical protein